MMVSKRDLLFQGAIFRFHVKLQGCIRVYHRVSSFPHFPVKHVNIFRINFKMPRCRNFRNILTRFPEFFLNVFYNLSTTSTVLPGMAKMAWLDDEEVDFHYLCSSQVWSKGGRGERSGISLIYPPGAKKDAEPSSLPIPGWHDILGGGFNFNDLLLFYIFIPQTYLGKWNEPFDGGAYHFSGWFNHQPSIMYIFGLRKSQLLKPWFCHDYIASWEIPWPC